MSVYMEKRAEPDKALSVVLGIVKEAELRKQALNLKFLGRIRDIPKLLRAARSARAARAAEGAQRAISSAPASVRAARGAVAQAERAVADAAGGTRKMRGFARQHLRTAQKSERAAWKDAIRGHEAAINDLEGSLPRPKGILERLGIRTSKERKDAIRYLQELRDEQELMERMYRGSGTALQRFGSSAKRLGGAALNTAFVGGDAYAVGSDLAEGDIKGAVRDAAAGAVFLPMFRGVGGVGKVLRPGIRAMERVKYNPVAGWAVRNPMTATMWAPMAYELGKNSGKYYNDVMDNVVTPMVMNRYLDKLEAEGLAGYDPNDLGGYESQTNALVDNARKVQGMNPVGAGAGIGALAGAGIGLGAEALSKKKKKKYLQSALLSSLLGGAAGAGVGLVAK